MTVRKYSSRAQQTTLSAALTDSATSATVVSGSALMGGKTPTSVQTYTVIIDPDTSLEEIVDVFNYSSGNTISITSGRDGSSPVAHSAGAVVRHMIIGRDLQETNDHIENTTSAHGLTLADVVKTTDTATVSSTMIATGAVGTAKIDDAAVTEIKIGTAAVTATKIGTDAVVTAKIQDGAVTSAKIADGTIVNADINSSAAIDKTKISGTAITAGDTGTVTSTMILDGTIVNADINASAAIDKTKISGTAITAGDTGTVTSTMIANDTIVNADINTSAQIAYGKLNLANSVVNADINASAAIDWTKLAISSTVSATELGYVDGVTSAIQTQIDSKLATSTAASTYAPIASPALTGTPTAPTAAANTNTTQIATTAYVQTEINDLIASAPGALDTLNELAAALGNDASFSTTVTNSLATKLPLAGGTMSGAIAMGTNKITGLGDPTNAQDAATKNYIDTAVVAPANLTGPITSVGNATSVAAQTGTGSTFVMQTSPTLTTPNIGVATATSVNGTTIPSSKTLVATDSTTYVVPSQTGNSGKYLTTDGTTSSWGTVASYSAPTLGSTSIASGSTVSNVNDLTINSTTIPTSKTLVATDSTDTLTNKTLTTPVITQGTSTPTFSTNAYTLVSGDAGKLLLASNSSTAGTINVPTNASVAFATGTQIHIIQTGSGQLTVSATTPATTTILSSAATAASPKLRVQYSALTLIKTGTDTWYAMGDIA